MLGAFSVENTLFAVAPVAVFGFGWLMEANQILLALAIPGLILDRCSNRPS